MKKNTSPILSFLFFALMISNDYCLAQVNLVPNPSFEEYSLCPGLNGGNANTLDYWDIDINTVDNFNSCDTNFPFNAGVPQNVFGYQCASTGNGYSGLYFYARNGIYDVREMIGGGLISPLMIGQKYYVTFKVSSAESAYSINNLLGLKFTNRNLINSINAQIIIPPPFIDNMSHVNTSVIISDTLGWSTIQGSFIADSAYNYFLLGCFYDNSQIDTILRPSFNFCKSYYYLDDVCISTDSLYCTEIKRQLLDVSADINNIFINSCINFSLQTAINYESFEWHFLGATPNISTDNYPTNICYQNSGNFDVKLIGHKYGGCADTLHLIDFIHVDSLTSTKDTESNNLLFILSENTILVSNIINNLNYEIIDILGREVKKGKLSISNNSINCNTFHAGTYIISVNDSTIKPFKFIINPKSN
jgi:hypothetical protein